MKNKLIILIIILAAMLAFSACQSVDLFKAVTLEEFVDTNTDQQVIKARITEVISAETEVNDYYGQEQIIETFEFTAKVLNNNISDETIAGRQVIDNTEGYMTQSINEGDVVYLYPSMENGEVIGDFVEYARVPYIIIFGVLFALVLIIFSGFKGLRALIALLITVGVILFGFVPLLLQGYNIMLLAVLACIVVTVITLLIVCGFTMKALSSIIGCTIGFAIAGLLAFIMQRVMSMTGLTDTIANTLYFHYALDMNGLMFAAIIIGALGATMDVGVSIASSLEEIIEHRGGEISGKEIIKSGMKIGSDIMGTMTNTLILAYVGSSLPIIILIFTNSTQLTYTLSWELFASEFVRAIAGSIGLVCTVPATAFVAALIHRKKKEKAEIKE